jgi:dimethylhistidine N-methyltransferase
MRRAPATRFELIAEPAGGAHAAFAEDVRRGLTAPQKTLPCRHFYDDEGSRLFEEICALPEYYLTRAEREILEDRAPRIAAREPRIETLVELGSGSAVKTRILIDALVSRTPRLRYVPIDVSRSALEESARALLAAHPGLEVRAVAGEYRHGLARLPDLATSPALLLWLGSNVGNLHRDDARRFLADLRRSLGREDRLLLGVDLRKDASVLEKAYDDAAGVTARFNRNLLLRVNRQLGGDFDPEAFAHRARYDAAAGRVEMHLVSVGRQRVAIEALGLTVGFSDGESIHTENSYKYDLAEIDALAAGSGFEVSERWLDAAARFSLSLLAPRESKGVTDA